MILDAQLLFSDAQAVTAAAASTNSIDLGSARNIGVGTPLFVGVTIDTAMTDSGSDSSVTVSLEGDSTTTFTPDATSQLMIIPALSAAGAKFFAPVPPGYAGNFRYIQLRYTPNNGNLTTGTFTAFLTVEPLDQSTNYPKGYVIG